jgi:hypothetical protein
LLVAELVVLIPLNQMRLVELEAAVTLTNHRIVLAVTEERLDLPIWGEELEAELKEPKPKMEDLE